MRTKRTLGRRIMADTEVSNEAAELLFEAEDVAELVAEITGEDVTVEADDTEVTFTVAEETYTCSADDADEIINRKMDKNEAKYPVEKAKGRATKYTELE